MPMTDFLRCAVLAVAVAAAADTAGAQQLSTVTLDARATSAGGIRTMALQQIQRSPQTAAFGIVLDPGSLITLSAQIAAARGKLAAADAATVLARSQAARAAYLYGAQHNISQAAFEAAKSHLQVAQAVQASAEAQLGELVARARTDWGARLGAAAGAAVAPLPQLESGAEQIVEVSLPFGQSLPAAATASQASTPDGKRVKLRLIGPAPRAAAGVAGPSLYYLMASRDSAPIGTPLTVALDGPQTVSGVVVPVSAVVWHDGQALVYRQSGSDTFTPVELSHPTQTGEGYFVAGGEGAALQPGQRIVITGAALVFSASQAPPRAAKAKAKAAKPEDDGDR